MLQCLLLLHSVHGCWLGYREEKVYFFSTTSTKVRFSSLNSKTGQTTLLNFSNYAFFTSLQLAGEKRSLRNCK
jgi:hypothetical protein